MTVFFATAGNFAAALLPLMAASIWLARNWLAHLSIARMMHVLIASALILDVPAARTFNELTPLSKVVGAYLFNGIATWTGLQISSPTVFELASYALAGLAIYRGWTSRSNPKPPAAGWLVAGLIPGVALLATAVGGARGHEFSSSLTQARFLPLYGAWTLIGIFGVTRKVEAIGLFWVVVVAATLKSLQGLYVYFGPYGGTLGGREYLIDHSTSDFLATAMIFIAACALLQVPLHGVKRWATMAALAPLATVYIVNDRRSSFLGVLMSALMIPFLMPAPMRRRYIRWTGAAVILVALAAGSWRMVADDAPDSSHDHSLFAAADHSADYRDLENFDLYELVRSHQVLGFGFGARIPMVAALPDITFAYDLFDLIPHNTLLFLWACAGPMGVAGLAAYAVFGIAAAGRIIRRSRDAESCVVGIMGFTMVVRWLVYTYADMGLLDLRLIALTAVTVGSMIGWQAHLPENEHDVPILA